MIFPINEPQFYRAPANVNLLGEFTPHTKCVGANDIG